MRFAIGLALGIAIGVFGTAIFHRLSRRDAAIAQSLQPVAVTIGPNVAILPAGTVVAPDGVTRKGETRVKLYLSMPTFPNGFAYQRNDGKLEFEYRTEILNASPNAKR